MKERDYIRMVRGRAKPAEIILKTLTPIKLHRIHMVLGLVGEIGEAIAEISMPCLDRPKLVHELGDCCFYLYGLCKHEHGYFQHETIDLLNGLAPPTDSKMVIAAQSLGMGNLDFASKVSSYLLNDVRKEVINNVDLTTDIEEYLFAIAASLSSCMSYYNISVDEVLTGNDNKLNGRYKGKGFVLK